MTPKALAPDFILKYPALKGTASYMRVPSGLCQPSRGRLGYNNPVGGAPGGWAATLQNRKRLVADARFYLTQGKVGGLMSDNT